MPTSGPKASSTDVYFPPTETPTASPTAVLATPTDSPITTTPAPTNGFEEWAAGILDSALSALGIDDPFPANDLQKEALLWLVNDDPANLSVVDTEPQVLLERFVMILLYLSTEGSSWTYSDNWLSDLPICEWGGVECNEDGLVTMVYLCKRTLEYISLSCCLF